MIVTPNIVLIMVGVFSAVCLWTLVSGFRKLRFVRENPDYPHAPMMAKFGRVQVIAGGAMMLINVLLNLPTLLAFSRGEG